MEMGVKTNKQTNSGCYLNKALQFTRQYRDNVLKAKALKYVGFSGDDRVTVTAPII